MWIHRVKRCDLSLFQLGLRLLDHLLKNELELPVAFTLKQKLYPFANGESLGEPDGRKEHPPLSGWGTQPNTMLEAQPVDIAPKTSCPIRRF